MRKWPRCWKRKLNRPGEAIAAYREVLSIDPGNPNALLALDGLFTRQELWEDLAENLELQMNLTDSDESQIQMMLRLAALREQKMGQVDGAIEGYRQILERESTNEEALSSPGAIGPSRRLPADNCRDSRAFVRGKGRLQEVDWRL